MRKTYFIDIDGTILKHKAPLSNMTLAEPEVLPGVVDFFNKLAYEDACIILTTGRRESTRKETEAQLKKFGLFWDHLIMGVGLGERIVINDAKPHLPITAIAHVIERDGGLSKLCES